MTDSLGYRAVFSLLIPATNAMVEPDMAALRLPGVTNQTFRFPFPHLPDTLESLMDLMQPNLSLMSACEPDRIIVGFTPEYMSEGVRVASQLRNFAEQTTGLPITMASDAVSSALKAFGAQRIGLVTPFLPEANRNVEAYFKELGFEVVRAAGFSTAQKGGVCTARISEREVREAFSRVDSSEVDVLVQVGTALVCAEFVEDLEARHGKPVIAVNSATYWLALRQHGILDHLKGYGALLSQH